MKRRLIFFLCRLYTWRGFVGFQPMGAAPENSFERSIIWQIGQCTGGGISRGAVRRRTSAQGFLGHLCPWHNLEQFSGLCSASDKFIFWETVSFFQIFLKTTKSLSFSLSVEKVILKIGEKIFVIQKSEWRNFVSDLGGEPIELSWWFKTKIR